MLHRLVLFLALLLPLQFAWAGAASYCEHESESAQARHFGHHDHAHRASLDKAPVSKLAGDNDCGTCHAAGSPLIFIPSQAAASNASSTGRVPFARPVLPTTLARAPDRPQWLRLA